MTWEPDLSGAVTAREDEAHVLVSTVAATNVIADTLVARQQIIDESPRAIADFVSGWFDAIGVMKEDPEGTNRIVATELKARFAPGTEPSDPALVAAIDAELAK